MKERNMTKEGERKSLRPEAREAETVEHVHAAIRELKEVNGLEEMFVKWLTARGWNRDRAVNLGVAVKEALTNGVKHGNKGDPKKKVELDVGLDGSKLTVTVRDEGEGFDLSTVDDPTKPDNLLKANGRGIHIYLKEFFDSVAYNEKGNEVTLTAGMKPTPRNKHTLRQLEDQPEE